MDFLQTVISELSVIDLVILVLLWSINVVLVLYYFKKIYGFFSKLKRSRRRVTLSEKLLTHLNQEVTTFYDFLKYYG